MKKAAFISILAIFLDIRLALAAETFPVTARLYGGTRSMQVTDLNNTLSAQGLGKLSTVLRTGVEATYPVARFLDFGFRYTHLWGKRDDSNISTGYYGELTQDSVGAILRVPLLKTKIVRADIFSEYGGTNTTFKIKSATVDGKYEKIGPSGWFGNSMSSYGASVSVGYDKYFIAAEAGIESNVVNGLKTSGTTTTPMTSMDLSGSYISFALVFDGVKAEKR